MEDPVGENSKSPDIASWPCFSFDGLGTGELRRQNGFILVHEGVTTRKHVLCQQLFVKYLGGTEID